MSQLFQKQTHTKKFKQKTCQGYQVIRHLNAQLNTFHGTPNVMLG